MSLISVSGSISLFLSVYLLRNIGGELTQDGDFMLFESSRYRGGYLYKTLAMSAIVSCFS